jgi:multimeric flavodoxin WrbA
MADKKYTILEYYQDKRKDWYKQDCVDMDSAKQQHRDNIVAIRAAQEWRLQEDRPLSIAIFHGSGRDTEFSCAQETSNSQMFLERGLELAKKEWEKDLDITAFGLRGMMLEPCNGCYSSASALCQFSCTCFPGDDITTKIYPAVVKADVLLWSTPVNQSMCSTRIKTVIDRLISIDGGYFMEELPIKDDAYRAKMIHMSHVNPVYDARMFGKVAAYFVTSKDLENTHEESAPYPKEFSRLTYVDYTVGALSHQGTEFGWFHADPFYAVSAANPDVELSYDKDHYDKDTASHERAKDAILASLKMAEGFRLEPPQMVSAGRINRT